MRGRAALLRVGKGRRHSKKENGSSEEIKRERKNMVDMSDAHSEVFRHLLSWLVVPLLGCACSFCVLLEAFCSTRMFGISVVL